MTKLPKARTLVSEGNIPGWHVRVSAKTGCRTCHSRGWIGTDAGTGEPIQCRCLKWEREERKEPNGQHDQ